MFRRCWSGLPADPVFPADLRELGYFVNNIDEIRSIASPKKYFKFFISKNERWNHRQRFAMNEAIEDIIHSRLEAMGITKIRLPLSASPTEPHVPIFATSDIAVNPRVVIIFGETTQDLGVQAYRVASGPGGIDQGSMVSIVRAIRPSPTETSGSETQARAPRPAVVLANPGQLWWWPEGGRSLTHVRRQAIPLASAVHWGRFHDPALNDVPGNETPARHVRSVFEAVRKMATAETKLDVIAMGDSADEVESFLNDDDAWQVWSGRMNSLAIVGGFYKSTDLKCEGFKVFLKERARAYIIHDDPLDYPVAGPEGNAKSVAFTNFGCPVFSAGEASLVEMMLISAHPAILSWMEEVASTEDYKNPFIEVASYRDRGAATEAEDDAAFDKSFGEASYGVDGDEFKRELDELDENSRGPVSGISRALPTAGIRPASDGPASNDRDGEATRPLQDADDSELVVTESENRLRLAEKSRMEAEMKTEIFGALGSIEKLAAEYLEESEDGRD